VRRAGKGQCCFEETLEILLDWSSTAVATQIQGLINVKVFSIRQEPMIQNLKIENHQF